MPVWTDLVEPVAEGVTAAVGNALSSQLDAARGCRPAPGPGRPGRPDAPAHARLHVLDAARPGHGDARRRGADRLRGLAPARRRSHRGAHARRRSATFAEGLQVDEPQARLYLAVREVARARLFGAVPWLGPGTARRGPRLRRRHHASTPTPSRRRSARSTRRPGGGPGGPPRRLFAPQQSTGAEGRPRPARDAARPRRGLGRRRDATGRRRQHLPQADALGEAVRRRRATGGPAEKTFGALVGLELRPRRLSDAANLFAALEDAGGADRPRRRVAPPRPRADRSRPRRPAGLRRARRDVRVQRRCRLRARPPAERRGPRVTGSRPRGGRGSGPQTEPDPVVAAAYAPPARRRRPASCSVWPAPDRRRRRCASTTSPPRRPPGRRREGRAPAHLTASCLVLDGAGERVLLTLHRRARKWFQFGGHLRSGGPLAACGGAREAPEESGIDGLESLRVPVQLDRHLLLGDFGRCREHLDVRYAAIAPPAPSRGSAPSRSTCGGGRWTPCPRAHARSWCRSCRPLDGRPRGHRTSGPATSPGLGRPRRAAVDRVVLPAGPPSAGQPVEVAARALHPGIGGEQPPELRVVRGPEQVGELVEQHVVEDVARASRSRSDTRIVPSAGVHEPQRRHRRPPSARSPAGRGRRGSGRRGARPGRRAPRRSPRAPVARGQPGRASARPRRAPRPRLNEAGTSTTVRPPSR